jgi:hypothetical protein
MSSDEYAVAPHTKISWLVHKFNGHHGKFETTYLVRLIEDEFGATFVCNCQAVRNCKHAKFVAYFIKTGEQP